jgi:hypothetical protein
MLKQYGKANIVITSRRGTPLEHVNASSVFDPRPIHEGFVMDKVVLGLGVFRVIRFSSVNIIPPVFHTHITFIHNWLYVLSANKARIETYENDVQLTS